MTTAPEAAAALPAAALTALKAALVCENAAVWAYGLVAAFDPADALTIATIRAGHLNRRDYTNGLIASGGGKGPAPAPVYSIPAPVTSVASARSLAYTVENDCAAAWRSVVGNTDSTELRSTALAGLMDSALWLTTLKMAAQASPTTVPFPGQV